MKQNRETWGEMTKKMKNQNKICENFKSKNLKLGGGGGGMSNKTKTKLQQR